MARRRPPTVHGVAVVDKPPGVTSHDVVGMLRRRFSERRVGHAGTLDPDATGVLVVALGHATRLLRFVGDTTKRYTGEVVLGVETDTLDAAGTVVATHDMAGVDVADARRVVETHLTGEIEQVPPMVSAVQVEGQRLHELARRGIEVDRPARRVTIHDLVLDAFTPGQHPQASFLVTCSAGTYVRTLAHDVGRELGVGASLTALRRVANGPFGLDDAHDPEALVAGDRAGVERRCLTPAEALGRCLPRLEVEDPGRARRLAQGGRLEPTPGPGVYAAFHGPRLLGVYDGASGRPELVWTRPEELDAGAAVDPTPEQAGGRE